MHLQYNTWALLFAFFDFSPSFSYYSRFRLHTDFSWGLSHDEFPDMNSFWHSLLIFDYRWYHTSLWARLSEMPHLRIASRWSQLQPFSSILYNWLTSAKIERLSPQKMLSIIYLIPPFEIFFHVCSKALHSCCRASWACIMLKSTLISRFHIISLHNIDYYFPLIFIPATHTLQKFPSIYTLIYLLNDFGHYSRGCCDAAHRFIIADAVAFSPATPDAW